MKTNPILSHITKIASSTNPHLINENGQHENLKDIFNQAQLLAQALKASGVKEGDTAVIASKPGTEFLKIIIAGLLLRIKLAIIDPDMGREMYLSKLNQLNPKWAFMDYGLILLQEHPILRFFYKRVKKNGIYLPYSKNIMPIATGKKLPIIQKHLSLKNLIKSQSELKSIEQSEENFEFMIVYTSGTVNEPKGVLHTVDSLNSSIQHIVKLMSGTLRRKLVTHLPHFMLIGMLTGLEVYVWDYEMSAKDKIRFLEEYDISVLFGPPADYLELIQYCKKNNRKYPKSLEHILLGSAPVHVSFLTRLVKYVPDLCRITCMYGMTENLVGATIDGRKKISIEVQGDLLGQPHEGVEFRIAEDHEIFVKSDQLYKSYLHKSSRPEWHPTGDLGYLTDQGLLVLTGRKKDMIIRRNFNIYPGIYEPVIKQIEGVDEAVMIGIYNEEKADEEVYLIIETNKSLSSGSIMKQLKRGSKSIDGDALPDHILFRDIPRVGRQSKIDKERMREEVRSGE